MNKPIPKINETLLTYIFDGQPYLLAEPMREWLILSRQFVTFVSTYQDKIRKKLHRATDAVRRLGVGNGLLLLAYTE